MGDPTQPPQPLPPPQALPPPPGSGSASPAPVQDAPVTNGMAISALITGLIGVVLFWTLVPSIVLGILAVVFGAIARGRATQGAPNGTMATVGLVLGIVAIAASVAMILLWTNVITSTDVRIDQDGVEINGLIFRR